GKDLQHVRRFELDVVSDDLNVRIERREPGARGVHLRFRDARGLVQHLALQIRDVDAIVVDDAERADAARREIQRRGRAEPAGTDDENARAFELLLPRDPDFAQHEMSAVAHALGFGQKGALGHGARSMQWAICSGVLNDAPGRSRTTFRSTFHAFSLTTQCSKSSSRAHAARASIRMYRFAALK